MADIRKIESLDDFNSFVSQEGTLNVLKLSASWCGPCRALSQIIAGLSTEDVDGVLLGEVDVDDEWFEDMAVELGIRGVPVLLAFKDGVEKERVIGLVPKDKLLEFIGRNK